MKIFKKTNAFTMAEILLSLTIIGVIATLTLPSLNGNINSKQFSVTFRKTYAAINQAVGINVAETGVDFSGKTDMSQGDVFDQIFVKRMGATKETKNFGTKWQIRVLNPNSGFIGQSENLNYKNNKNSVDGEKIFNDNVTTFKVDASEDYQVYTMKDGLASIIILADKTGIEAGGFNCNDNGVFYLGPDGGYNRHFCLAYIDVNGPKGPNTVVSCTNAADNVENGSSGDGEGYANANLTIDDCIVNSGMIQDVYPVLIYGDRVVPATRAVLAIFQDNVKN